MLEGMEMIRRPATCTSGPTTTKVKNTIIGMTRTIPSMIPCLGSEVDHHDPHPGYHGAAELAEARHVAQRVDRGGQLAEDHLADLSNVIGKRPRFTNTAASFRAEASAMCSKH